MTPVRVAHVTTVDVSLRYLLQNQLRSIQDAGYDVVGLSSAGSYVEQLRSAGIPHIAVPMTRTLSPFADLVSLWRLWRVLRSGRFSIVHTHTPKAGLLGQIAARLAGVPVVVNTLHGFYFHDNMRPAARRFYIAMETIAALCSTRILSQNREDIDTAIRERICSRRKISYLGNGIDLTSFDRSTLLAADLAAKRAELGLPDRAPVVGFVGRLAGRRKGFLDFLKAAQAVSLEIPDVRFVIVGEADHGKADAVEPDAAKDFGVQDRCIFLGQRPNRELPLLYALMNAVVLPSEFEGLPRTLMEAAAMGVPAVATDVKGNREAVEHGRNGFLVPYGDVPALADGIVNLLEHSELAESMGKEGRLMAEDQFDERRVFDRVISEYARLLSAKGISAPVAKSTGKV